MAKLELKVGNKNIDLKPLTLNDLISLEGKVGKKLSALTAEDFGMGDVRHVIWLSAKKTVPDVTEEQIGEALVMGQVNLEEIQTYLLGGAESKNLPTG